MPILALDDRDPSIIYSAGWRQAGSANEYNSTTSWSSTAGQTARLTFNGTTISVYGTIPAGGRTTVAPESTYSVDGGTATKFKATQTIRAQYSQLFYQSPLLPDGQHNLTITNANTAKAANDAFFLDFILVVVSSAPGAASFNSSSSSSSTSTTPTPTPTAITVTVTASSSTSSITDSAAGASSPTSTAPSSQSNSNAAGIAGGVIAGIVLLFLLIFGFIFWRRRRNQAKTAPSAIFNEWTSPANAGGPTTPSFYDANQRGGMPQNLNPPAHPDYGYADHSGAYAPNSHGYDNHGYTSGGYTPPSQLLHANQNYPTNYANHTGGTYPQRQY